MTMVRYKYSEGDIFVAKDNPDRIFKIEGTSGALMGEPQYSIRYSDSDSFDHAPAFIAENKIDKHFTEFDGYIVITEVEA